jgi:CBS domain-containing protein
MNVSEIMTESPACCTPETGVQSVAQLMVDNDCGCIPVVESEETGKPVGVITDRDIVTRAVAEGRNPLDLTAADVMTKNVVTVTPGTSIEECCDLMEQQQIRRITVVDDNGACCGIVAQADIANHADQRKTAEVVQEVSKASA